MTVGGFGPGNVGAGQQQPMQRDIETSAWAEAAKVIAGLISPDQMRSFVETNPQTTWKYSTEAGKPDLDHILTTIRMNLESLEGEETEWQALYREFIAMLPEAIQAELEYQMTLPLNEQRMEYIILNRIAVFFAMYMSWLTRVTAPKNPNSPEVRGSEINAGLPLLAMAGGISQADEIATQAREYLSVVGPNDPNYDAMSNALAEYESIHDEIRSLAQAIADGTDPNTLTDEFSDLANRIHLLLTNVTNAGYGDQLQILIPSLQAMETLTAALSIENASPTLLLSFTTALTGINSSESAGGLIGPHLQQVMEGLIGGILSMVNFGTGGEIQDLQGLINDLVEFGNEQTGGQ